MKRAYCSMTLCAALIGLAFAMPSQAELIAHWPLDNDGTELVAGYDGDVPLDVSFTPNGANPNTGGAAEFVGADGIEVPYAPELNPEDAFTITAWANPSDTAGWNTVVSSRTHTGNTVNGFIIYNSPDTNWDFWTGGGGPPGDWGRNIGPLAVLDEWTHLAITYDGASDTKILYVNGVEEAVVSGQGYVPNFDYPFHIGAGDDTGNMFFFTGLIDDVALWDETLSQGDIQRIAELGVAGFVSGGARLLAGDANQDLKFDQLDLVKVQVAAKYLTGRSATWGEGDWDGAPGGRQGSPPPGDGAFNQVDIIAALGPAHYLKGPYAAVRSGGIPGDGQTSIIYNPGSGEVSVDAPAATQLTSINIDSAGGVFTGAPAANLGGSFDNDSDTNIFKATFGSSFGSLSFGNVAQTGLSPQFLLADLTVVGSLAGGGSLGDVDLIYVPEPSSFVLTIVGALCISARYRRRMLGRKRCNPAPGKPIVVASSS